MAKITCIMCPIGCSMTAELVNGEVKVNGNTCKRGQTYAIQELTQPKRMVTTLALLENDMVVSCKTSKPIDKALISETLIVIKNKTFHTPISIGQVLIPNILGTDVDIVATSFKF